MIIDMEEATLHRLMTIAINAKKHGDLNTFNSTNRKIEDIQNNCLHPENKKRQDIGRTSASTKYAGKHIIWCGRCNKIIKVFD
jgi:hypothetical protein